MAKKEKPQEKRYQCLMCYRTYKDEQSALDCHDSVIQIWTINYRKWGKRPFLGR